MPDYLPPKQRYVFAGQEFGPKPGEMQATRDLNRAFVDAEHHHGLSATEVSSRFHTQTRIAKHAGKKVNFNRPRVAPAKSGSVSIKR